MKEKQTSYNRQFNIFILKKTIRVYLVMFMARLITSSTFFVFSIQSTGIASIPSLAPIMAPMKNDLEQLQPPATIVFLTASSNDDEVMTACSAPRGDPGL